MHNPKGCWRVCAAAALALFCTVGLNANTFSVYLPYLTKLFDLTAAQSSGFMTVRSLFSLSGVYLAKRYYEKLDIRVGYSLAMLLSVLSLFLCTRATGIMGLYAAGAVCGLCYGIGGMYPVAILIYRWFPVHGSLAMGLCAAGTGLAITVGAPVVTALIENQSMQFAMYCEMGFLLLCTILCFALLRNDPGTEPHHTPNQKTTRHPMRLSWLFFAIVAIGIMNGSFSYLTIHYTTEGFDPYRVSTVISVIGVCLVGAKFLLGELLDLWGGYRSNWLFLPAAAISCILFSLGGVAGYAPALIAACLYGVGDSVATVGISVYARDLSKPETFAATQQQFQVASQLGSLVCTLIPGFLATATGNYRSFYGIITVLVLFATFVIQHAYKKAGRR